MNLHFNSDIVNSLLKPLGGGRWWGDRRPKFVIFVVQSALIVGGRVVVP